MLTAIIQARMGSKRLPGKSLMDLNGKPLLGYLVGRVRLVPQIQNVVIATTRSDEDDPIAAWAQDHGIAVTRGSPNDLVSRYYEAAQEHGANPILRITGDCPLIDPALVSELIERFQESDYDYGSISCGVGPGIEGALRYPDGLDCEIFTLDALFRTWLNSPYREHATQYLWANSGNSGSLFRAMRLDPDRDYSACKVSIDTAEDLELVRQIAATIRGTGWKELWRVWNEFRS